MVRKKIPFVVHADPRFQFRQWLTRTDTVILVCRINGHWNWDFTEPAVRIGKLHQGVYQLEEYCRRGCGTKIIRYIAPKTGVLAANTTYTYPPGYKLPQRKGGTGYNMSKEQRGQIRLELLNRRQAGEEMPENTLPDTKFSSA